MTTNQQNGIYHKISDIFFVSNFLGIDDIFKIKTGNQIPVDAIVLDGYIEVNESLLTGESVPVKKNVGDYIMAGSFVTGGSCFAKADKVGDECYVQKLTAKAKRFKKPHSELMTTLNWVVKIVGLLIIPIALGIGLVNYTHTESETYRIVEMIRFIVERTGSVIIGMIPAKGWGIAFLVFLVLVLVIALVLIFTAAISKKPMAFPPPNTEKQKAVNNLSKLGRQDRGVCWRAR